MAKFATGAIKTMKSPNWFKDYTDEMAEVDYNSQVSVWERECRHKYRTLFDAETLTQYKLLKSDNHRDNFIEAWKDGHKDLEDQFPRIAMPIDAETDMADCTDDEEEQPEEPSVLCPGCNTSHPLSHSCTC